MSKYANKKGTKAAGLPRYIYRNKKSKFFEAFCDVVHIYIHI